MAGGCWTLPLLASVLPMLAFTPYRIALWIALALTLFLLFVWAFYMRLESLVFTVAWLNKFMSCTQSSCSHRLCLGGLALWGGDQILETEVSRAVGAN